LAKKNLTTKKSKAIEMIANVSLESNQNKNDNNNEVIIAKNLLFFNFFFVRFPIKNFDESPIQLNKEKNFLEPTEKVYRSNFDCQVFFWEKKLKIFFYFFPAFVAPTLEKFFWYVLIFFNSSRVSSSLSLFLMKTLGT
jgi:hypothetical protein